MHRIKLVEDTVSQEDLSRLSSWLETGPRLTKSSLTSEFEEKWSEWLGCKHSVFVNSGSSANLGIIYGLILTNKLKNKKIVFPCLSWVTTVSPAIQLGLEPILCDTDKETLGLDLLHLEIQVEPEFKLSQIKFLTLSKTICLGMREPFMVRM